MSLPPFLVELWPHLVAALTLAAALAGSIHAVLWKRDSRAAIAWVGLIWLVPLLGAVLYWLLGINRIRRKAHSLQLRHGKLAIPLPSTTTASMPPPALPPELSHLSPLVLLCDRVTRRPLVPGNRLDPLEGGQLAYPAMLDAVRGARRSISLCTYIFDNDALGTAFADALADAVERGVEVRVLIDAVGVRYTTPPITGRLRRGKVRFALFLPSFAPARLPFLNLRNHRKILVVDGAVGFTGGMNLRADFVERKGHPASLDLHFRVLGPVVRQLQESFAEDWAFTTREELTGETWFPHLEHKGTVLARGIPDGPDVDFEVLRWVLLGALGVARHSVRVVTPYFLPDSALVTAINVAALRGVEVDIVLPRRGNLRLVQWASNAQLWQNLQHGCRIHLSPPPFDHTKLMVVDEAWTLVGSANWDPRSLRLNFEFNVECYDRELAAQAEMMVLARRARSRPLTLQALAQQHFLLRLRDGVARLFAPYL